MTTYNNHAALLSLADGTTLTQGSGGNTVAGGDYVDALVSSGTGTYTCETDYGDRVYRFTADGSSVARWEWNKTAHAAAAAEAEFEGAAAPTGGDNRIVGLFNGSGYAAYVNHLTDGRLRVFNAANTSLYTTTATVPTGAGWRVYLGAEKGTGTGDGEIHFALYTASDGHGTSPLETYDSSTANAGTADFTSVRFGVTTTAANATYDVRYLRMSDSSYAALGPLDTGAPPTVSYVEEYVRRFDFSGSTGTAPLTLTVWTQASGPTITPVIDGLVGEFVDDATRTADIVMNYTIEDSQATPQSTSGQVVAVPPQRRVGPLIRLSGSLV